MKTIYFFFVAVFILSSCHNKKTTNSITTSNNDQPSKGWSQQDKEKYSTWCRGISENNVKDNKSSQTLCDCSLEAAQKIFSSYDEANRIINAKSDEGMTAADNKKHSDFENAMGNCAEGPGGKDKDDDTYISKSQSGWSQADKDDILNDFCKRTNKSGAACNCYLNVAMKIFPTYNEWKRIMIDNAFSEDALSEDDRQKEKEASTLFYDCRSK